jgi:23S rRNA pseudouridine2605 synthase
VNEPVNLPDGDAGERLQRYLARCGVASRRAAERLIQAGRVGVNGEPVTKLGTIVRPGHDRVTVDGRAVGGHETLRYYAVYKPPGMVSSVRDRGGRATVMDLVRASERLYPVGRLVADSEGVLPVSYTHQTLPTT